MRKRNRRFELCFTEKEFETISQKAHNAGMPVGEYLRQSGLNHQIHEAPPADILRFIREIRRVGINIDQLLLIARTKDMILAPDLRNALDDLIKLETLVIDTYRSATARKKN